jgi:hypothetical protein
MLDEILLSAEPALSKKLCRSGGSSLNQAGVAVATTSAEGFGAIDRRMLGFTPVARALIADVNRGSAVSCEM